MELKEYWPTLDSIPHPPGRSPETGDLESSDFVKPMQKLYQWSRELGPIFETQTPGFGMVVVTGGDIARDLFDDERFEKFTGFGMEAFRPITGDGLFTAHNDEENWALARRILTPAFSREALMRYHPALVASVGKLMDSWRGSPSGGQVDLADESIAVSLDMIGQAGFGYDFNSFAGGGRNHTYVRSLIDALAYSVLPPAMQEERRGAFEEWVKIINGTVDEVIDSRAASGAVDSTNMLGMMMNTPDPVTGKVLPAQNMRYQITTFVVAGYGTTASLIAFALYFLARHPQVLKVVREQVETEVGTGPIEFDAIARLRPLRRVIDETLRLWSPTPAFLRVAKQDTTVGGKYPVRKGGWAAILTAGLHRDPAWGSDALEFNPERFTSEQVRNRDSWLYKPFGTGPRDCIGRQFALHSAGLVLAELVRGFDIHIPDDYDLSVSEGGFFVPEGMLATVTAR